MTTDLLEEDQARHPLLVAGEEAERAVLGSLLLHPERAGDLIPLLDPRDFTRPVGEVIWEAAADLYADDVTPDHPALLAKLASDQIFLRAGGHRVLLDLRPNIDGVVDPRQHADLIRRAAAWRRAQAALRRAERALATGDVDSADAALAAITDAAATGREALSRLGATDSRELEVNSEVRRLAVRAEAQRRHRAAQVAAADYAELYFTRDQLNDLPTPEPLIERILPRHSYAILRGRDHSYKSFVALDWACCLATGKAWQSHHAATVRVLYIAGEGVHGLAQRVAAWEYGWGHIVPDDMLTIRRAALDLHQPGPAFDHLLEHVTTGNYGLVIVDTLRRVSGTADGNSSEMGAVIDNLDRIKRATTDGTVLVVAHTSKADGSDTRGFSGIEDDADVVWAAKRDEDVLTLELTKMKDGADGRTITLQAHHTAGSLTLAGLSGRVEINTTESQTKILDTLRELFPDGATTGLLQRSSGLPESTYYRAVKELRAAGHVANIGTPRRPVLALPALEPHSQPLPDEQAPSDLHGSHNSHQLPLTPPTTSSHSHDPRSGSARGREEEPPQGDDE